MPRIRPARPPRWDGMGIWRPEAFSRPGRRATYSPGADLSREELAEAARRPTAAAARAAGAERGERALGGLDQDPALARELDLEGLARATADQGLHVDVGLHRRLQPARP